MPFLVVFLSLIWGSNWIFMKAGMENVPPILFSSLRFLTGGIVLLAISYYKKIRFPERRESVWIFITTIFQNVYPFAVLQTAMQTLDSGLTSVLYYTTPIWLSILAHFFLPNDKLNFRKIIGLSTGIFGLFLVMKIDFGNLKFSEKLLLDEIWVISAAVSWAIGSLLIKKSGKDYELVQFTTYQVSFAGLMLLASSIALEDFSKTQFTAKSIFSIGFAGIAATSLAFFLWFKILRAMDASNASISLLLIPAIAVFSGWIFLDEKLTYQSILGIGLILSSVFLVNRKSQN
ncbi:MAG: DMT family transporter [Leptospiraceae bacterium]|nr:DMT family transporter [Leptospiraceae bacterium]